MFTESIWSSAQQGTTIECENWCLCSLYVCIAKCQVDQNEVEDIKIAVFARNFLFSHLSSVTEADA